MSQFITSIKIQTKKIAILFYLRKCVPAITNLSISTTNKKT